MIYTEWEDLSTYVFTLGRFLKFAERYGLAEGIIRDQADEVLRNLDETLKLQAGQMKTATFRRILSDASRDLPVHSVMLNMTGPELVQFFLGRQPKHVEMRKRDLRHCGLCHEVLNAYVTRKPFTFVKDGNGWLTKVERRVNDADVPYWIDKGPYSFAWIPEDFFP